MKLNTRKLKADEIKVRIAKVNGGGVTLLLWKSAIADMKILEEILDDSDYEITYPREDTCRISIWDKDKDSWVSKEGVGEGTSPKCLANDALARAGTAWGIGRELFTAGELFVWKDKLSSYSEKKDADDKPVYECYDQFTLEEIEYEGENISHLKIAIGKYGETHHTVEFNFGTKIQKPQQNTSTAKPASKPIEKPVEEKADTSVEAFTQVSQPKTSSGIIAEDEIILIGNCRGKKYSEVKGTETFISFLKWAEKATTTYGDEKKMDQMARFKQLAKSVA